LPPQIRTTKILPQSHQDTEKFLWDRQGGKKAGHKDKKGKDKSKKSRARFLRPCLVGSSFLCGCPSCGEEAC
jgi:hypothetical protein